MGVPSLCPPFHLVNSLAGRRASRKWTSVLDWFHQLSACRFVPGECSIDCSPIPAGLAGGDGLSII